MAAIHLVLICVMHMINIMTHVFVISFSRYRVPVTHTVHRQHPAPVDVVGSCIFSLRNRYKLQLLQELGVTPPLGFWDPLGFRKFETPAVGWVDMAGLGGWQRIVKKRVKVDVVQSSKSGIGAA